MAMPALPACTAVSSVFSDRSQQVSCGDKEYSQPSRRSFSPPWTRYMPASHWPVLGIPHAVVEDIQLAVEKWDVR